MRDNIILIGFMGSGKTSIGERLARKLSYSFLDTDQQIEKEENMSVKALFEEKGEEEFRRAETQLLRKMEESLKHTILSTGGGLPLREENAALLKKLGFVVYLKVSKETVIKRLKGDLTRPLLLGGQAEKKIEDLLAYREPMYEIAAHLTVSTEQGENKNRSLKNREYQDIMEEIIRNYQLVRSKGKEKSLDKDHIN